MFKKIFPIFLLSIIFFAGNAMAAHDDPLACVKPEGLSCSGDTPYFSPAEKAQYPLLGGCRSAVYMNSLKTACIALSGGGEEFKCNLTYDTNKATEPIDVNSSRCGCDLVLDTTAQTNCQDAPSNRVYDACENTCGDCKPGWVDLDSSPTVYNCQPSCDSSTQLRTPSGCISMNTVASLLAPIFGSTIANLTTDLAMIIPNMTTNPSYYFLKPTNGIGTEYKYGTGGDTTNKWRVETDWADTAYYLTWKAIPTQLFNLFQNIAGVKFCTLAAECGVGGSCVNSVCVGTVALGVACTNTGNSFCQAGLVCDLGNTNKCINSTGQISPSDIAYGNANQVLTSLGSGITGWADAAGIGLFQGISAASNGAAGGYAAADAKCNTAVTGSHVCTADEIFNTVRNNPNNFTAFMGKQAWVNNGPPGHSDTLSNDCKGWNFSAIGSPLLPYESGYGRYGSVINITNPIANNSFLIQFCNQSIPFACCK